MIATAPLAALAGCSNADDEGTTAAKPASPATTTSAKTTTGGIDALEGAGTDPVVKRATAQKTALLRRVALARHEGYDRVVFEFENDTVPGYRVEYVKPPLRQDGSGNVIKVAGDFFLRVRMEPSSGFDLGKNEGELVYTGPRRIKGEQAGTPTIDEAVQISDFEAVLTWAIGLKDRVDFRVTTLEDPARVVVDLRNH